MPDRLPPGPYRMLLLDDGTEVPYYIIPSTSHGRRNAEARSPR